MWILTWVILGGLAGWVASMVMKTNERQGIFGNIVVGVLGALLGGFVMSAFGGSGFTGFNIYSFLVALGGAVALLWLVQLFRRS